MKSLAQLIADLPGRRDIRGPLDRPIRRLVFDSRQAGPDTLFVALSGTKTDGARYIEAALSAGATAIVTEADSVIDPRATVAVVDDARRALSRLAAVWFDHPSDRLRLIGVTGTKGKTTTTWMIQAILRRWRGRACRFGTVGHDLGSAAMPTTPADGRSDPAGDAGGVTAGTRGLPARNTTPESLELQAMLAEACDHGVDCGVMEVSSHALLTSRVEDLRFAAAAFSNLSLEHTEFHPDMEHYFAAKTRLFTELLPRDRPAAVMIDDAWGRRLAERLRADQRPLTTVSLSDATAAVHAAGIEADASGSRFRLVTATGESTCRLAIPGHFNIGNALLAAAVTLAIGVDRDTVVAGLEALSTVPGRFESIPNQAGFSVVVDYAHSPHSLENILIAVRQITPGRLITVFGCGGNRSHEKRPMMGGIAARSSDVVVVTSDNPRQEEPMAIIAEILGGIDPATRQDRNRVEVEPDRRRAIALAIALARPGDTVVIAGKGHESGQIFADRVVPFDDRQVAAECLANLGETPHEKRNESHV